MNIQVRLAGSEDIDIIVKMIAALITELGGIPDEKAYYPACAGLLQQQEYYKLFLAFTETNPCAGILSCAEISAIYAGGRFGVIQELYVVPELRSSSIGHRLMEAVIENGRANHWKRIEVGAPHQENWERTIAFYKREGFVEIGPRLKLVL